MWDDKTPTPSHSLIILTLNILFSQQVLMTVSIKIFAMTQSRFNSLSHVRRPLGPCRDLRCDSVMIAFHLGFQLCLVIYWSTGVKMPPYVFLNTFSVTETQIARTAMTRKTAVLLIFQVCLLTMYFYTKPPDPYHIRVRHSYLPLTLGASSSEAGQMLHAWYGFDGRPFGWCWHHPVRILRGSSAACKCKCPA